MRQLRELHDKHGYDWNQMAIFYRMNALSRVMEDALRRAKSRTRSPAAWSSTTARRSRTCWRICAWSPTRPMR